MFPLISKPGMGRIVQQILDEMSSGYRILLFLNKLLFDTVNSFCANFYAPNPSQHVRLLLKSPKWIDDKLADYLTRTLDTNFGLLRINTNVPDSSSPYEIP